MRPPRHLLHVFPSFALGGAQVRTVALMAALGPGFRHTIVTLDGRSDAAALLPDGVACRVQALALEGGWTGLGRNLRRCRRLLDEAAPDLLLTYNFGAMEMALARRLRPACPHLHFEDGFGPGEATRQLPRRVWLRRLALSGDSLIVVPSRTLERIAIDRWRFRRERVLRIPNGIALDRFANAKAEPDGLRRLPDECLIGTVGMLRPEKNVARLLRLFASLPADPPVRLVVTGDGSERPRLEALAVTLGIADRVTFTGHCPAPEAVLAGLDVFALTSDTEQMPYSLIEAMAAGLPVVATDVGDVRVLLPEASRGFVVAPHDEARAAAALASLVADPALRQHLGALNQRHAREHFGIDLMVRRYEALLVALLPSGAPCGKVSQRALPAPLP